ncbi:MAG: CerR family C-terminal domain-containing protein [Phascolarctobacterium sp.]|nr:CerR family C-terminal domain-containing protein [Phascolarctobacterium sp.]
MQNIKVRATIPKREDGKETRALIIECAGNLIGNLGYEKVTSKAICQMAKVNMAAVNYHFGSRDGLYLAVLEEVHNYFISLDALQRLYASDCTSKEKIERFFDFFLESVLDEKSWHVKVWAREVLAPSSFVKQVLSEQALPKISVVMKIFSEYTGLAEDDPKLYTCYFSAMAPLMMSVFIRRNNMDAVIPHIGNAARQTKLIKEFIFAGLDNFNVK